MEGSGGVERALLDNGRPLRAGEATALKNTTSSCLSLGGQTSPQRHFLHLARKQKVKISSGEGDFTRGVLSLSVAFFTAT